MDVSIKINMNCTNTHVYMESLEESQDKSGKPHKMWY